MSERISTIISVKILSNRNKSPGCKKNNTPMHALRYGIKVQNKIHFKFIYLLLLLLLLLFLLLLYLAPCSV